MNSQILLAILKNVVVPELATFIAAHFAKTGELPTQEELQTAIDMRAAAIVMKGEDFINQILSAHPELVNSIDPTDNA